MCRGTGDYVCSVNSYLLMVYVFVRACVCVFLLGFCCVEGGNIVGKDNWKGREGRAMDKGEVRWVGKMGRKEGRKEGRRKGGMMALFHTKCRLNQNWNGEGRGDLCVCPLCKYCNDTQVQMDKCITKILICFNFEGKSKQTHIKLNQLLSYLCSWSNSIQSLLWTLGNWAWVLNSTKQSIWK